MGSGAPLSLNWKVFFPRGKENLRRKICSQLEPELAVLSPKTGRHLVPADFLLNFIWLSKIDSFWADWQDFVLFGCLTQFYLSSSHHTTFYLFFSREKATQNYCHSFPRLSCSFENSGSLEQSKAHGIREHSSQGYNGPTPHTRETCFSEQVLCQAIFACSQSLLEMQDLPPRPTESECAF